MLKTRLSGSLVFLMLLSFSAPAAAQEVVNTTSAAQVEYQVYRLPKPTFRVGSGADGEMCYSRDSFKKLLKMDNDLWLSHAELANSREVVLELGMAHVELRKAMSQQDAVVTVLQKERRHLTEKWKSENKLRHKAENRPRFGTWVPWAISGVLAAGLGGVVLATVVSD